MEKLIMAMQIVGFTARLSSLLLWIQFLARRRRQNMLIDYDVVLVFECECLITWRLKLGHSDWKSLFATKGDDAWRRVVAHNGRWRRQWTKSLIGGLWCGRLNVKWMRWRNHKFDIEASLSRRGKR